MNKAKLFPLILTLAGSLFAVLQYNKSLHYKHCNFINGDFLYFIHFYREGSNRR